jgi:hypothetical protein
MTKKYQPHDDSDEIPNIPRLDLPDECTYGHGYVSVGHDLATKILQAAARVDQLLHEANPKAAALERARVIGMLEAYGLIVRPVLNTESESSEEAYSNAVPEVAKDLAELFDFWEPIRKKELPALERYHRMTEVAQVRPDLSGLVIYRAEALAEAAREGADSQGRAWTSETLSTETGLSEEDVRELIERAIL